MGLALFKDDYRGGPLGYFVGAYHLLKALALYPRTPLYVLYKCFSYKSYLLSLRVSAEVYPRHDAETPRLEKSIIDEFGFSLTNEHDTYDPTTCVINRESARLHTHVAPVTARQLQNPNIAFFTKQNPSWDKVLGTLYDCPMSNHMDQFLWNANTSYKTAIYSKTTPVESVCGS